MESKRRSSTAAVTEEIMVGAVVGAVVGAEDPSRTILSAAAAIRGRVDCWSAASLAAGGKRSRKTVS